MSPMMPLTAGDLRTIAEALDPIEDNELIVKNPVIGRIEVYRPDGDDLIGHFVTADMGEDDWYGFVPVVAS